MLRLLALAAFLSTAASSASGQDGSLPEFRMQEIETKLGVGYAVLLVDVDGDGKKDIVVVDTTRVLWFRNPDWKRHVIIEGSTKPDNVCIDALDIDGDGQLDFALGADWKPFNTKSGGTLQWLKRGKSLDEPWSVFPIDSEPVVHRIRFADVDGSGKPKLISVPLMGRNSSAQANWTDGEPVRITAYAIPADPTKDRWTPEVLDASLHVIHNFHAIPRDGKGKDLLTASYEGVHLLSKNGDKWGVRKLGEGNQANPKSNRGASEIKQGTLKSGKKFIATVEPWHGNQIVVYSEPKEPGALWTRHVLDDELKWGHAVWPADLDGDGGDELVIGVRDDGGKRRRGVRIYKALDDAGTKWARTFVDEGSVAVEDLACADLDGDGKLDIVAVGRQTHNVRIYWNGKK